MADKPAQRVSLKEKLETMKVKAAGNNIENSVQKMCIRDRPEMYSEAWKKWSYESLPMIPEQWQHEVKKETATQYKILKNLMHDTSCLLYTSRVEKLPAMTTATGTPIIRHRKRAGIKGGR